MTRTTLLFVIFVEGFASLGIEVIALRRLVPYMGSSITVTAPTIGLFLAALAAGYWTGGRIKTGFGARVALNFAAAALIAGVGLSSVVVQKLFGVVGNPAAAYLLFMLLVVCPPAWLLAQTVPLLTNVLPGQRRDSIGGEMDQVGAASGLALTASTIGSVLGASLLALVVMQRFGVSAAVLLCGASLALALPVAGGTARRGRYATLAGGLLAVLLAVNLRPTVNALETAYADYRTVPFKSLLPQPADAEAGRLFLVNNQRASRLEPGNPPRRAPYIERMQQWLLDDLHFYGREVLVLGAGGFTLSGKDTSNRYTFVDIDPNIGVVAERDFLKAPINGEFLVDDARRFIARTDQRFDAIAVDVYSTLAAVPSHLVTLEFWRGLRRPLTDGGAILINLILDSRLQQPYARNLLATIELALGRCEVEVLNPGQPFSNVLVLCQPAAAVAEAPRIYTDELNRVDLDRGRRGY